MLCQLGFVCNGTGLLSGIPCPIGFFCNTTGMAFAWPCPANYLAGLTSCTSASSPSGLGCYYDVGMYSSLLPPTLSTPCLRCPVGAYCPVNASYGFSTSIVNCSAGLYNNLTGQTSASSCLPCSAGQYQSQPGQSSCTICPPPPVYCPRAGMAAVSLLPPGETCPPSATGEWGAALCAAGWFH